MDELIFQVEEDPEMGFVVTALGASIVTQADDLPKLRRNVRDAVECHFAESAQPRIVRLQFVRDEFSPCETHATQLHSHVESACTQPAQVRNSQRNLSGSRSTLRPDAR